MEDSGAGQERIIEFGDHGLIGCAREWLRVVAVERKKPKVELISS